MASAGPRPASVRTKLVVNTILAVSFIAISAPTATRIPVHEWLSFAFIGILGVHLLFSWSWIAGVTGRFLARLRGEVRFNYVLDALSYLAMVVVMISGIVISEAALPAMGFPRPRDRFWSIIHNQSSKVMLVLVGIHLAMHWDWVVAASKRLLSGMLSAGAPRSTEPGAWLKPVVLLSAVSLVASLATVALGTTGVADRMRQTGRRAEPAGISATGQRAERGAAGASGAAGDQVQRSEPTASASEELRAKRRERQAQKGQRRAGPPQLGWRQRYLRPARQIAMFMGIPFLVTLAALGVMQRARAAAGTRTSDPLEQQVD